MPGHDDSEKCFEITGIRSKAKTSKPRDKPGDTSAWWLEIAVSHERGAM
jgi:hypothetical protein